MHHLALSNSVFLEDSLSTDTLGCVPCDNKDDVVSLFEGTEAFAATSFRPSARALSLPQLSLSPSDPRTPTSWYAHSPTDGLSSDGGHPSTEEWEMRSEWINDPDTPVYSTFPSSTESLSTVTFGRGGTISPNYSDGSRSSSTIVLTEGDRISIETYKLPIFDELDEELITSPIDSFAALCWTSAVSEKRISAISATELRFSKLYNDDAQNYEAHHWKQCSYGSMDSLPTMQFSPYHISPEEVSPWEHLPRKAVSVLNLRSDVRPSRNKEKFVTTYRRLHKSHYRGQTSVGAMFQRCRIVLGCLNGIRRRK